MYRLLSAGGGGHFSSTRVELERRVIFLFLQVILMTRLELCNLRSSPLRKLRKVGTWLGHDLQGSCLFATDTHHSLENFLGFWIAVEIMQESLSIFSAWMLRAQGWHSLFNFWFRLRWLAAIADIVPFPSKTNRRVKSEFGIHIWVSLSWHISRTSLQTN